MKKLFTLVMLMIVMSITVTAQSTTLLVKEAFLTHDFSWDRNDTENQIDVNSATMLVTYNVDKNMVKVNNKANTVLFLKTTKKEESAEDEDGDVMITHSHNAWDQEGNDCDVYLYYYKDPDVTLFDCDVIMRIHYEDFGVQFGCELLHIAPSTEE